MAYAEKNLCGSWQFKQYPLDARKMSDLEKDDWLNCSVPNSIYTNLIGAGRIDERELFANPENYRHIDAAPWIFRKSFDIDPAMLLADQIDLVFEGLDTVATIWLNEKIISKTYNMFITHRVNVTSLLKEKNNVLLIKFESPTEYAQQLMSRYDLFKDAKFFTPHRVYLRKAQFQFGWDFAPPLPGCGIIKPISIQTTRKARIEDIKFTTVDATETAADVKIDISAQIIIPGKYNGRITFTASGQKIEHGFTLSQSHPNASALIRIDNPELWFPSGSGPQNLYNVTIELADEIETLDTVKKQFGIRTVNLVRKIDNYERKFQFEINSKPVFVKGANWSPPSILVGSISAEQINDLVKQAADANMNMLRVWGGGYYESEEFYNACDRLGIMVWQDFPFACADYPAQKWFTDQVKLEAAQAVKRIRNHPSLVLLCGNNEIDWIHAEGWLGTKFQSKPIFHKILPEIISEHAASIPYIPSTPLSGSRNYSPEKLLCEHKWDVWNFDRPITDYLTPAKTTPPFASEFGVQSMPSIDLLKKYLPHDQIHSASQAIEKINYQPTGPAKIARYISELFPQTSDIEKLVRLSQITQARAMKIFVEHLRANRQINSGTLFWQFSDCAPAASWSCIDYAGNKKALYYYAKKFYAPLLVTAVRQFTPGETGLRSLGFYTFPEVVVINESDQAIAANMKCNLMNMKGHILDQIEFTVITSPATAASFTLPKNLAASKTPHDHLLQIIMQKDDSILADNLYSYLPDKYLDWQKAEIRMDCTSLNDGLCQLKLTSDRPIRDVYIQAPQDAKLSDNFVDLLPNMSRFISIQANIPGNDLKSLLTLHTLHQ